MSDQMDMDCSGSTLHQLRTSSQSMNKRTFRSRNLWLWQEPLNRQQLVTSNEDLIFLSKTSRHHPLLHLDGEVNLVDGT